MGRRRQDLVPEGELTKTRKGSPYLCYDFVVDGIRYSKSTKKTDKAAAEKVARKVWDRAHDEAAKRRIDGEAGHKDMTWQQAVDAYLASAGNYASRLEDRRYWDWLKPRIGPDTPVSRIDNALVTALINARRNTFRFGKPERGTMAAASVNRCVINMIQKVLNHAKLAHHVHLPREPRFSKLRLHEDPRIREMAIDEELSLEGVRPDLWPLFRFMLETGLRRRAALIRWKQVLWRQGVIRVTEKGNKHREVEITPEVAEILRGQLGKHADSVFTFVSHQTRKHQYSGIHYVRGEHYPVNYGSIGMQWTKLCEKANVEDLHIHDIRKTTGARIVRATGDLLAASKVLGHANISMTARHYSHITTKDIRKRLAETAAYTRYLKDLPVPGADRPAAMP